MKPFCRLADPQNYQACEWDLDDDEPARVHWVEFFKGHVASRLAMAMDDSPLVGPARVAMQEKAMACQLEYCRVFDEYLASPGGRGRVTIATLDTWSEAILHKYGFVDPYAGLKKRENERVLPLLPALCKELDSKAEPQRLMRVVQGVFAGNIFDMGAKATADRFREGGVDIHAVIASLPARPWLVDDYDLMQAMLLNRNKPHHKAIFFVDNAGSDFLLGAMPMIRWLAMRGTHVVIAANERPSLNDMTVADIREIWPRISGLERSFARLPISLVSTGTGQPLIDLSAVSDALNTVAANADLVILEGMGRGVESNFSAKFDCDSINIAMLKDEVIARRIGGKVFDLVLRCRPVA